MTHPLQRWPQTGRRRALVALILATIALQIVLALLDSPLRDSEGGTVSLELAGSEERAGEIIDAWRADDVLANAAFVDGLDFLFAPVYALAVAGGCVAAANGWRRRGRGRLAVAGIAVAWVATSAIAFDWLETGALAVVMLDEPAAPWPQVALAAAIPKFAATYSGLLYGLGSGAVLVVAGLRHRP